MIIVVDGINKSKFTKVLDEMYMLRARVFQDRMGWDVKVRHGREMDEFDELDPAYIISVDDDYNVIGCARLLQTTGPHMLSDVFFDILDGEPPLRSSQIWESTRFCVDRDRLGKGSARNSVSYATAELMVGIMEYARDSGIDDIITVIDPVMDRVMQRSDNAPYGYVGKTADMGKVKALAALVDCTDERINKVRAFAGIEGDIFLPETVALAACQTQNFDTMEHELQSYCMAQLEAATTERERSDAIALKEALVEMLRTRRMSDA
ncbi:MAG: acyl-homoserine-lactone synthase [Roseovarius sp.]